MIVQCEQCHTKYNIDDSKITPQGVRVRCAKCQHVFSVKPPQAPPPPPPAEGEDFLQDFESFEKFHKDLMETPGPETGDTPDLQTPPPSGEESPFERGEFDSIPQDVGAAPPSEGPSMAEFPTEEWPSPSLEEQRQTEFMEGEMDTLLDGLSEYFQLKQLQEL